MANPFRKKHQIRRSVTFCCSGELKNLFTSTAYQDRFDKNICESNG